ncbi:MAG: ROK family protein [Pseudomonadota bacterium]
MTQVRIGIDLGGTKIETIGLSADGQELYRNRIDTPQHDYDGTIRALVDCVHNAQQTVGENITVGIGTPGVISSQTDRIKNANSVWLNDRRLLHDVQEALGRPVRMENDANCLAVSEATDGAGAGHGLVFAIIVGTGCGAGIAVHARAHQGPNGLAGEWGHSPLAWPEADELPGPDCYCGKTGCIETWLSGTGVARDYFDHTGEQRETHDISLAAREGDKDAKLCMDRWIGRFARSLAHVINLLDPDVVVVGGGLSQIEILYQDVPKILPRWVFGGEVHTPIRPAAHGDSSGVRGAAWLWET